MNSCLFIIVIHSILGLHVIVSMQRSFFFCVVLSLDISFLVDIIQKSAISLCIGMCILYVGLRTVFTFIHSLISLVSSTSASASTSASD